MVQLICGIRRFDGAEASARDLDAMLCAMSPAGKAVERTTIVRGSVALGILHVSPGANPPDTPPRLMDLDGRLLVADLKLYARGAKSLGSPVSELEDLNRAVRLSRVEGLARLHGDFAFACFHPSGEVTLGRDHLGVRPLQYVHQERYLAFASLPAALLRTGLAPRTLDDEVVETFPLTGCAPSDRTFFRDVARVPPGHLVHFGADGAQRVERYWRLQIEKSLPAALPQQEAEREVARLLVQAVQRRLPSTRDVAAHLSGGLDSSSIALIAARLIGSDGRTLHGYSYQELSDLPGLPKVHEGVFAQAAAQAEPNIRLHAFDTAGTVKNMLEAVDPETLLIVAPGDAEQRVLRDVSRRGIGLLFSGWGGDQIITNYGTAAESELFIAGEWRLLARQLKALKEQTGQGILKLFVSRVAKRCLPEAVRALKSRAKDPRERFLAPGRRPRLFQRNKVYASSRRHRRQKVEEWWYAHRLEMLAQQGAAHGVAYTFPMLDLDLIRYGMRLPGIFFNRDGLSRSVFRGALKGIVPDRVRLRMDKTAPYFLHPYRDALLKEEAIAAAEELAKHPTVRRFLDMKQVEGYIRAGPAPAEVLAMLRETEVENLTLDFFHDNHLAPLALGLFLRAQDEVASEAPPPSAK